MCILPSSTTAVPTSAPAPAARSLPPSARQQLARDALTGQPVAALAAQHQVSRKFVYQQLARADRALDDAFAPQPADDQVLFHLPVTAHWLRQLSLALVLVARCSLRGVVELVRDVFDYDISLGTVHNIVQAAVAPARAHNQAQDLARVRVGAHDEIFQNGQPVLVGIDALSSYCYLLSLEDQRDGDTWALHLLELQDHGFDPEYVVADGGTGLRAGQAEVLSHVPCRSDVFHALQEVQAVVTKLENRADEALTRNVRLERKIARSQWRGQRAQRSWLRQRFGATQQQTQAMAVADAVALLGRWLRYDVLGLAGPSHADRGALYDFIVAELEARVPQAASLLGPLVTYLKGQRDDLLAFAAQLDADFASLAAAFAIAPEEVRELFAVQTLAVDSPQRWRRDAPLRRQLGGRYYPLSQALEAVRRRTVRASSLVENLNSRLRNYFFLRRHLGNDYLAVLQFFLNHRRYPRSEHPERVGHSPAELLTGQGHSHWLELLGYTRFCRN
jgi:hypothetical protein